MKKVKIGILDVIGIGSLGDEAIQQAMIQNILKYRPDAEIYGFASNPKDTQERHKIQSFPINRIASPEHWWLGNQPTPLVRKLYEQYQESASLSNPLLKNIKRILLGGLLELLASVRAYRNLKRLKLDLLIISGGGQLDDDFGGAWYEPYIIFFWGGLAKLLNVKFAIVSVGVGNINENLSRFFIRIGLSLACYRSYRDETSKKYLENVLGFRNSDPIYPDLAHSLQLEQYHDLLIPNPSPTIAINPLLFVPGYWSGQDSSVYDEYLKKLAEFIFWLIQNNYKIVMFSSYVGEHQSITEDLKTILRNNGFNSFEDNILDASTLTVDDLIFQLAQSSIIIASRLHSVLLATLLNKPVIALSYHFKVDMLMKEMGQSEYCLRIDRFKVEDLKEKLIVLNENCETIKANLERETQRCRAILDKQYSYLFQEILDE